MERNRCLQKVTSKDYKITKEMLVMISQEKFLSNYKNKSLFIKYLIEEFQKQSIECHQGEGEADELIVETAINKNNFTKQVYKKL